MVPFWDLHCPWLYEWTQAGGVGGKQSVLLLCRAGVPQWQYHLNYCWPCPGHLKTACGWSMGLHVDLPLLPCHDLAVRRVCGLYTALGRCSARGGQPGLMTSRRPAAPVTPEAHSNPCCPESLGPTASASGPVLPPASRATLSP